MRLLLVAALGLPCITTALSASPLVSRLDRKPGFPKSNKIAFSLPVRNESTSLDAASVDIANVGDKDKASRLGRVKRVAGNALASLRATPILPCLVTFAIGFRFGGHAAPRPVTGRIRQYPLVFILIMATVVREVWRITPSWVKRSLPWRRSKSSASQISDPDDMASLDTIAIKLQSLFNLASTKLVSPMDDDTMRASFLTLLHLMSQIKKQRGDQRDKRYEISGEAANATEALAGMDETFEYADWAYNEFPNQTETSLQDKLEEMNFNLIRHDATALPGRVAHYVAINPSKKLALISIKGSSNLEDLLTDVCGTAVRHTLEAPFVKGGNTEISAHEGIFISSKRLVKDLQPLVEHMFIPTGYNILITGHSLGAGAAVMLGLLLRSKFPILQNKDRLQVLAFASPPILDLDSALACSSFATTIVNNADIIPRSSLYNMSILLEFLNVVNRKLEEAGKNPKQFASYAALVRMLQQGADGEMLLSAEEISDGLDEAFEKVEERDADHLYVAGRVVHMYDLWGKEGYGEALAKELKDTQVAKAHIARTAERVRITDGTSKALKFIEADDRILLDHLSPGYRSSIGTLLLG